MIEWGDLNGDGTADLLYREKGTNDWYAVLMEGTKNYRPIGRITSNWCKGSDPESFDTQAHTSWADLNGDGQIDTVCDYEDGQQTIRLSRPDKFDFDDTEQFYEVKVGKQGCGSI